MQATVDQAKRFIASAKHWIAPRGLIPLSPIEAMLPEQIRAVVDCRE